MKEAGLGVDALSVFGSSYIQGNLGIGTPDPTAALDITGGLRIRSGIPAADKMLTSDDSGVASWEDRDKFRLSSCTGNGSGVKCTPNCGSGWVLISNINVSELNTYGARPSNQYWTGVGLCQKLR